MKRREFMGIAAGGCALMATTSLNTGCAATTRPAALPLSKDATLPVLGADGARILRYASLAPSSHNSQPWYVKPLSPTEWVIGFDRNRRLPVVDPDGREMLLSLGCFTENLVRAAGALGYSAEATVSAVNLDCSDIVLVNLQKATPDGYPLERITTRRTLRNKYLNTPITPEHLALLTAPLGEYFGFIARESPTAAYLQQGAVEAFTQQTWDSHAQRELAGWIRFSNREAESLRDGLTTATMEIDGLAGWWVRSFMNKDDVTGESFREKGIEGVAQQAKQGGGWLVITSDDNSPAELIAAGRRYEAMFLLLRELGIAAHPMSQMLEEKPWREEIAQHLGLGDRRVQFVVRLGYVAKYPQPVSLRRPVSAFVIGPEQTPPQPREAI